MKKIFLFATMFAVSLSMLAQEYMHVWQDGKKTDYVVTEVDSVTFNKMMHNGHEYVDLGLPSGTLWATCNVGATKPEDYGDYFAWGEIEPKTEYSWETYKWCNGSNDILTKYNYNSNRGTVDNKMALDISDDAAHTIWKGNWRIPTKEQFKELLDNCTWKSTNQNKVKGHEVISNINNNSIFIPWGGFMRANYVFDIEKSGHYHSCSLSTELGSCFNYSLSLDSLYASVPNSERQYGFPIRPVCTSSTQREMYIWQNGGKTTFVVAGVDSVTFSGSNLTNPTTPNGGIGVFSVSADKQVTFSKGNLQYHPANDEWRFAESQLDYIGDANSNCSSTYNGWLDLFGWSTRSNKFGVSTSTDFSDYYVPFVDWGRNKIGNDVPNTWRTLSSTEWDYLLNTRANASSLIGIACVNNVNGLILLPDNWTCPSDVTFKSGFYGIHGVDYFAAYQTFTADQWSKLESAGAVFLPASGNRYGSTINLVRYCGYYWSASANFDKFVYSPGFDSEEVIMFSNFCCYGQSVRLVKDIDGSNTPNNPNDDPDNPNNPNDDSDDSDDPDDPDDSDDPDDPIVITGVTVKAKVPAHWIDLITVWVWPTGGEGEEFIPVREGDWYVYTHTAGTELNIIFKNGFGWTGAHNQTVDITGITQNTCIKIEQEGSGKATYTIVDCLSGEEDEEEDDEEPEKPETPATGSENGYEYVDLGLSVKWATCNVGANKPEDYGDYFAWGETQPKSTYTWRTYKWCRGSYNTLTKYNTDGNYGTIDSVPSLFLSDDAARANWGGSWRMPTMAEQDELRNNCTWTWTTQNGVNGYKVTSKSNGNSIFLPAAGARSGSSLDYAGSSGNYWSSSLYTDIPYCAYGLGFYSDDVIRDYSNRYYGLSVRPVYGEYIPASTMPTVTTSAVTQITETTAVAGGNVTADGGASVTERGVVYSTTANPTTASGKVVNGSGTGSFTCNLTGLQASTTYYVRAYAINEKGTAYGEQVTFKTLTPIVPPTITTSAVTQITETTAVAGGNVTADGGASVTERGVVYGTSENPTVGNSKVVGGSGTGAFTCNLTGLQASTTYYVRAYAINEKGTAYGEQVSFTTLTPSNGMENGYEWVDLGLSVKWATINVGATKPEEYGDYFAWGETAPKEMYDWSTYIWCNGSETTLTKYCTNDTLGTVDNKTQLELSDDAARVNWGGSWRMPTDAELTELRENCTWTWTTQNGVNGNKVTGTNGNSIFLPAVGYRTVSSLYYAGIGGCYWSSSLFTYEPYYAYFLEFYSSDVDYDIDYRFHGRSVRPVCEQWDPPGLPLKQRSCGLVNAPRGRYPLVREKV